MWLCGCVVAGKPYVKDAAQAKLMASETATFAAHQAIQILGNDDVTPTANSLPNISSDIHFAAHQAIQILGNASDDTNAS